MAPAHPKEPMSTLPLKHLHVQGYQSLHDVDLTFEPFTVLVGPSSSGKSAVVRSIDLLLRNKRGTAFIEHGQKKTQVQAQVGTHTITLNRGTGTRPVDNAYILDDEDPFTKLGGAVPDRVTDVLRLPADLTIAGQFDSPHLLTLTAPEITRTLGALTNVDTVHKAAAGAKRQRLQQSQAAKVHRSSVTTIDESLERMGDLEQQDTVLSAAESALAAADAARDAAYTLERRVSEAEFAQTRLDDAPSPQRVDHLDGLVVAAQDAIERVRDLDHDITLAERAQATYDRAAFVPNVSALPALLEAAEQADSRYDSVVAGVQAIATAQAQIRAAQSKNSTAQAAYEAAEQEFHDALEEAGTCPLCEQVITR